MSKKKALHRGQSQGELFRLKQTLRKQNDIIMKSKASKGESAQRDDANSKFGGTVSSSRRVDSPRSPTKLPSVFFERQKHGVRNLDTLKKSKDMVRFYIKQKFGADIPVNAKLESYQQGDDQHHKIEKYLKGKGKDGDDPVLLAHLYNDYLQEIDGLKYSDTIVDPKKNMPTEARGRVTEILNVGQRYKH